MNARAVIEKMLHESIKDPLLDGFNQDFAKINTAFNAYKEHVKTGMGHREALDKVSIHVDHPHEFENLVRMAVHAKHPDKFGPWGNSDKEDKKTLGEYLD